MVYKTLLGTVDDGMKLRSSYNRIWHLDPCALSGWAPYHFGHAYTLGFADNVEPIVDQKARFQVLSRQCDKTDARFRYLGLRRSVAARHQRPKITGRATGDKKAADNSRREKIWQLRSQDELPAPWKYNVQNGRAMAADDLEINWELTLASKAQGMPEKAMAALVGTNSR